MLARKPQAGTMVSHLLETPYSVAKVEQRKLQRKGVKMKMKIKGQDLGLGLDHREPLDAASASRGGRVLR